MENSNCIVSVAFREPYVSHSQAQFVELMEQKVNADGLFFRDELPFKGGVHRENIVSEFQKSLYGFKPHAIQQAVELGYKMVIWFDPSVLPTCSVNDVFDELSKTDMLVIKGDRSLSYMTNDKAYNWFGLSKGDTVNINHIGGTFYGFNFNNPKTVEVFNLWKEAEESGIFGTQDDFMAGHWADESCMALAMFKVGVEQRSSTVLTYKNQKEL